jgi:lipoprotein NlpI
MYRDAVLDMSKAISLEPKFTQAYIARGNVYMKLKHFKKAAEDFTLSIEINPDFARGYLNRGMAFKLDGRNDKAVQDLKKFLSLYNKNDNFAKQIINYIIGLGGEPD